MPHKYLQSADNTYSCVQCAAYARFSDDQSRKTSIEDQLRNCREAAEQKGWTLLEDHIYSDEERTGTTMFRRPGFARLMAQAKLKPRPFDRIIIDDTSRMGRNMADVLAVVTHWSVSNPWFSDVFMAKAHSDEQFSKSHGKRVHRGRVGRFEAGFNPGGRSYGYKNVPVPDLTRNHIYGHAALLGIRTAVVPVVRTVFFDS